MSNHIHMIIGSERNNLAAIIRDFKRFTSIKIIQHLKKNTNDNRVEWILQLLRKKGHKTPLTPIINYGNNHILQKKYLRWVFYYKNSTIYI